MPRATPINARRNAATQWMVEVNDECRYVTGILRRHRTKSNGEPWPLTDDEAVSMIHFIERAQHHLDLAANQIIELRKFLPKEQS